MLNLKQLHFFQDSPSLLKEGLHGLEKEALRVTSKGDLSSSKHPSFLGSPLTNPFFSLDFAEAQIELISKPHQSLEKALDELYDLEHFLYEGLHEELLWPMSTPCALNDEKQIKLAHFGYTPLGYQKWLYRKGLSLRYGKAMQLMSGIHYSFSCSEAFWKSYAKALNPKEGLYDFISDQYLHLVRNFLRVGWICSYLFGASPFLHSSYAPISHEALKKGYGQDFYGPYATSIRMSPLGYYSKIQSQNAVSFNEMKSYLKGLDFMLKTKACAFEKIGVFQQEKQVQINDCILQIEAEHYSRIRPKPDPKIPQRPLEALSQGIHYVETRILDVCPFSEVGLSLKTLQFMHLLLWGCLLSSSPPISKEEQKMVCENQRQVALWGRKKGLELVLGDSFKKISLKAWASQIIESLKPIAQLLDQDTQKEDYQKMLHEEQEKVEDASLTPSAKMLQELLSTKTSYLEMGLKRAQENKALFQKAPFSEKTKRFYASIAKASSQKLKEEEEKYEDVFCGYEDLEVSTQVLLKEAQKQGLDFKFLDRGQNLVELSKGQNIKRVKQATITPLDSMITHALMEHKAVSKALVASCGLHTAKGKLYKEMQKAIDEYDSTKEWVVKPNHTNMGVGISFVGKKSPSDFKQALKRAFLEDNSVLVEEKAEGDEHRFLVIQDKVVAVCQRTPAHVIGDGKSSISQLIDQKNQNNLRRSSFQKPLQKTLLEKALLKKQGHHLKKILKKGEVAFLKLNSNVSTGGESIDVTESIDPYFKEVALKAAKALGAHICGVDLLIPKKGKNYTFIEINHNPALYLHRLPTQGKKRYVEKEVLSALGF